MTRGAQRDRHDHRLLVRSGRPDLERRLADHPVVTNLERRAANGHNPAAGDLTQRRLAGVAHGRMIGGC